MLYGGFLQFLQEKFTKNIGKQKMSRTMNVAGMRKKAQEMNERNQKIMQQQQMMATTPHSQDSSIENYTLVEVKKNNNNLKRKRPEDENGGGVDIFDQRVQQFSNNPNLGYVAAQKTQIQTARAQQKLMKSTIQNNFNARMERGRQIREVQSVPSHMNISPIQYYPRPYLKKPIVPPPNSSSAATTASQQSCAGNYRTRIPHKEIVEMCTKKPTITTREELDKFLKAVEIEPIMPEDDNDNDVEMKNK